MRLEKCTGECIQCMVVVFLVFLVLYSDYSASLYLKFSLAMQVGCWRTHMNLKYRNYE